MYPNPAKEIITVLLEENTLNSTLKIINMQGLVLLEQQITDNVQKINISDLAQGAYYITVSNGQHFNTSKRFIKID